MQYLKKAIRDKIFSSGIAEFKLNGFNNASIRTIAQNSGISIGNIYRYYKNKEDLYVAVVNPLLDGAEVVAELFKDETVSIKEKIAGVVDLLHKFSNEYQIIKKSNTPHYTDFFDILADGAKACLDAVLNQSDAKSEIKNPGFSLMMGRAFISCILDLVNDEDNGHLDEYAEEVTDFFFNGAESKIKRA